MPLNSVEVEAVDRIKGVTVPRGVHFRQIIVTGPPCSGKTSLVQKLGGWPEEGCIDIAQNLWWRSRVLAFRPREVHMKIPFRGYPESHTVFDREWLAAPTPVDYGRIQIPPGKSWLLRIDWKRRFVFDFQLPPAERIYAIRRNRALRGTHPVDGQLTREEVERQSAVYEFLASHFHRCGLQVVVRTEFGGMPRFVSEEGDYEIA